MMGMDDTEGRPIGFLESRYMASIILFLHENGPSRKTEIYESVGRNMNMPRKIQQIIDLGIMEEGMVRGCSVYSLTESGERVAEHLKGIEDLIP